MRARLLVFWAHFCTFLGVRPQALPAPMETILSDGPSRVTRTSMNMPRPDPMTLPPHCRPFRPRPYNDTAARRKLVLRMTRRKLQQRVRELAE